jgi:hypothetical protein
MAPRPAASKCLVREIACVQYAPAMVPSSARHVVVLLLAVLMSAAMSLSAAWASEITVKMAAMTGMDMPAEGDCAGCPDDGAMTVCQPVCVVPILALLPQELAALDRVTAARLAPPLYPPLYGRDFLPDPHPPRSKAIV